MINYFDFEIRQDTFLDAVYNTQFFFRYCIFPAPRLDGNETFRGGMHLFRPAKTRSAKKLLRYMKKKRLFVTNCCLEITSNHASFLHSKNDPLRVLQNITNSLLYISVTIRMPTDTLQDVIDILQRYSVHLARKCLTTSSEANNHFPVQPVLSPTKAVCVQNRRRQLLVQRFFGRNCFPHPATILSHDSCSRRACRHRCRAQPAHKP